MHTDFGRRNVWDVAPAAILRPVNGLELETGYRFGNLQDPDFAVGSGRGWYLTLSTRITENSLPTVAEFWRSRLGG